MLMKRPGFVSIFFMLLLSMAWSCKTAKKATNSGKLREQPVDIVLNEVKKRAIRPDWFSGRAKIGVESEELTVSFTAQIHLQTDSVLYLSLRKLGLEVARVLITPDSVFVINRFNSEYYKKGLDYLEKTFHFPGNFALLQDLLLGNPVASNAGGSGWEMVKEPPSYHLSQQTAGGPYQADYWVDGQTFQVVRWQWEDVLNGLRLELEQEQFGLGTDAQNFSYIRKALLDSRETGPVRLSLEFTKVEFDTPKEIQFVIPDNYQRVE